MSSNDIRLTEKTEDIQQETGFNDSETVAFLPADVEAGKNKGAGAEPTIADENAAKKEAEFYGLTREQLELIEADPKWVKIRRILFAILVVGWVGMLVAAIVVVVLAPKCPPNPNLTWYEDGLAYSIYPRKYQDSNSDAVGDLKGIEERLEHLKDLSVKAIWLEDILNSTHPSIPASDIGNMDDFRDLTAMSKKMGIRVVINLDLSDPDSVTGDDAIDGLVRSWTSAGAEGFVLTLPDTTNETTFNDVAVRLQSILDEEFNKKDDRDRVIISGEGIDVSELTDLKAVVFVPTVDCDSTLTDIECRDKNMEALGNSNATDLWKILVIGYDLRSAECNLALKLTLPGTPRAMHGDEIGFNNPFKGSPGYMRWNDSTNEGFSDDPTWRFPSKQRYLPSVLAQKSLGFADEGTSFYHLFKNIADLRAEEPSLQWGTFQLYTMFNDDVVAFVREAEGYPPIIVAMNPERGVSGSLVYGDYTQGEVLVASGVDIEVGETVELSAIYLPPDSVFIARMVKPAT